MRSETILSSWALWGLVYVCFRFLAWSSRVACTSNCEACVPLSCEQSVHIPLTVRTDGRCMTSEVFTELDTDIVVSFVKTLLSDANVSEKCTVDILCHYPENNGVKWSVAPVLGEIRISFVVIIVFMLWRDPSIFIYWVNYDVTVCSGRIGVLQNKEMYNLRLRLADSILSHIIITVN